MAVTSCHYDRRICSGQSDEFGMGIYTLGWVVKTDSAMGPNAVLQGAQTITGNDPDGIANNAVPLRWDTYSYQGDTDQLSYARDFKSTQDPGSVNLWSIEVTYKPPGSGEGSATLGGDPVNSVAEPTSREPVMWWDREVFTYEALYDKDGKAIVNKVQDYYPEPIELESTRGVLVVEKNYSSIASVRLLSETYDNAVNRSPWFINGTQFCAARQALCREVSSGPPRTEQGYVFFTVSFRFCLQPTGKTWDVRKPEYGQFHWERYSNGQYKLMTQYGPNGEAIPHRAVTDAQALVKLNDDGTRRPHDQETLWTDWRVRKEVDFNNIGL